MIVQEEELMIRLVKYMWKMNSLIMIKITTFARMTRGRFLMDGMHPFIQLLYLTVMSITFFSLFTLLGMYLVKPLFGITTIDVVTQNALTNPEAVALNPNQVNALKLLQFMASIGAFLIPAILFAFMKFPGGDFLRLNTRLRLPLILLAIIIFSIVAPFISFTYELNQGLNLPGGFNELEKVMRDAEDAAEKLTSLFLKMPVPSDLFINVILIAILPAISEELLFRGCIQQVMKEWWKNIHVAIWVTAVVFSFIHFEFYGFLPRLLLGALLGYLFYWSGNLWVPIIAHALNNGGQVVLAYLHEHGVIQFDIMADESLPAYIIVISTLAAIAFLFLFRRISDQRKF
ncbi:MAG: CPBP family intramembrane metalloprotease, partial [Chitinophagales bacterium]|nr:CPBP family intramembrane metalloprotease [Chitinophagales bacterium]